MPDMFYSQRSLNVEIYAGRTEGIPVVQGDVTFYLGLARAAGGRALELGCGTGRIVLPLARAGIEATGLDLSQSMLDVAAEFVAREPPEVAGRATFIRGDMTDFALGRQFGLVYIAFRSFMMLSTPEEQRRCLEAAHRHLVPGGTLAIDLFDPLLDLLVPGLLPDSWTPMGNYPHPDTFNLVRIEVADRMNDPLAQVFEETWRFTEVDRGGNVLRQEEEVLRMRWTYRYEMRYLLELCGFEVLAEYSDYFRSPPAYGKEQVWVARAI
jgi:SAM-dependent methyltransferase